MLNTMTIQQNELTFGDCGVNCTLIAGDCQTSRKSLTAKAMIHDREVHSDRYYDVDNQDILQTAAATGC